MERWQALFALTVRQHSCLTIDQAERLGIPRHTLDARARREGWQRPYRGVLVVPGAPASYRQEVAAAVLSAGPGAAAAGSTAAALWGLTTGQPRPVVVIVRDERSIRPQPGRVVRRSRWLEARDLTRHHDLPLTRVPWTLTDCAHGWTDGQLSDALVVGDRLRLSTFRQLDAVVERRGTFPGRARILRVMTLLYAELGHSGAERTARRLLAGAGVVVHPRPYPVLHRGKPIAEIDLAIPQLRYGAEIDGPHHLMPAQARADRARDRLLGRLGWTIDRFTLDDVYRTPEVFVRQVVARLSLGNSKGCCV